MGFSDAMPMPTVPSRILLAVPARHSKKLEVDNEQNAMGGTLNGGLFMIEIAVKHILVQLVETTLG